MRLISLTLAACVLVAAEPPALAEPPAWAAKPGVVTELGEDLVVVGEGDGDRADLARANAVKSAREAFASMRRVQVDSDMKVLVSSSTSATGEDFKQDVVRTSRTQASEELPSTRVLDLAERPETTSGRFRAFARVAISADDLLPTRRLVQALARPPAQRRQALADAGEWYLLRRRHGQAEDCLSAALALPVADEADRALRLHALRLRWEARLEAGDLSGVRGDLAEARRDLDPPPAGLDRATFTTAIARCERRLAEAAAAAMALPQELSALAASAGPGLRLSSTDAASNTFRWESDGDPRILVCLFNDGTELAVTEPNGSRAVTGSGQLRFGSFPPGSTPTTLWLWALDPASPALAVVRRMTARRLVPGAAGQAQALEWTALAAQLKAALREATPARVATAVLR